MNDSLINYLSFLLIPLVFLPSSSSSSLLFSLPAFVICIVLYRTASTPTTKPLISHHPLLQLLDSDFRCRAPLRPRLSHAHKPQPDSVFLLLRGRMIQQELPLHTHSGISPSWWSLGHASKDILRANHSQLRFFV